MLMGVLSSYLYLFDYLHERDRAFALADQPVVRHWRLQEH